MVFSSISFLYYFLPLMLCIYFIAPYKLKNTALLIGSLLFYFWGEPKYAVLLLFSSAVDYINALIIERYRGSKVAKGAIIASIVINLSLLGFFKYSDFFIDNFNALFGTQISLLRLTLPIGISFYTFQTMSYSIDVYRGDAKVQRNPLDLATYVALFPQLIAGPIVRYKTIDEQINTRSHTIEGFSSGISRFVIGLSKKVLIANNIGELNAIFKGADKGSVLILWISTIAFALQAYFDFSGYSDMAIGLGKMFGFDFPENFNYPFISKSISEFWNRWHISLGKWFRDYIYIPLGGNRTSKLKWIRNIMIVWLCTGIWHGASWNFVLWGIFLGLMVALEKLFLDRFVDNAPAIIRHIYVLFILIISFVLFENESMNDIYMHFKGMLGLSGLPLYDDKTIYYVRSFAVTFIIAILGATPLLKKSIKKIKKIKIARILIDIIEPICYIGLIIVITGYLVDSSFNPFLYFRF